MAIVAAPKPTATIDAPAEATAGETVVLSATESHVSAGSIAAYRWQVGNETYRGPAPIVTVPETEQLAVAVTVETAAGRAANTTQEITVTADSPLPFPTPGFGLLLAGGGILTWLLYRRRQSATEDPMTPWKKD